MSACMACRLLSDLSFPSPCHDACAPTLARALSGGRRHSVSYHPGVPLGAVWWSGTLCFLPSGGAIGGAVWWSAAFCILPSGGAFGCCLVVGDFVLLTIRGCHRWLASSPRTPSLGQRIIMAGGGVRADTASYYGRWLVAERGASMRYSTDTDTYRLRTCTS